MSGQTPVNGKERKMKTPTVHFIPELLPIKISVQCGEALL
jgi:hypothetical protein